jgi:hypothetical protein
MLWMHSREFWMIHRGKLSCCRRIWLLAQPIPPLLPARCLFFSVFQCVVSAEQHVISRGSSSWWFICNRNLESSRSTKTTVNTTTTNWFRKTCKESITTFYYWPYTTFIMQSTGPRNTHNLPFLFFALLFFEPPARKIRHDNLPDLCATLTRWIYSPEKGATSTHGFCLPERPPSPLRIPRQDPARHPSPPPPPPGNFANGGGGRGQGADPARPCILNRYFYFHSLYMNGYIFLYDTT